MMWNHENLNTLQAIISSACYLCEDSPICGVVVNVPPSWV